jgi:hypothetical protein
MAASALRKKCHIGINFAIFNLEFKNLLPSSIGNRLLVSSVRSTKIAGTSVTNCIVCCVVVVLFAVLPMLVECVLHV